MPHKEWRCCTKIFNDLSDEKSRRRDKVIVAAIFGPKFPKFWPSIGSCPDSNFVKTWALFDPWQPWIRNSAQHKKKKKDPDKTVELIFCSISSLGRLAKTINCELGIYSAGVSHISRLKCHFTSQIANYTSKGFTVNLKGHQVFLRWNFCHPWNQRHWMLLFFENPLFSSFSTGNWWVEELLAETNTEILWS